MKTMKKLASVLLALVMVMALAAPAFASGNKNPGSITISNASRGEEYKLVKLFNASYNTNTKAIVYTPLESGIPGEFTVTVKDAEGKETQKTYNLNTYFKLEGDYVVAQDAAKGTDGKLTTAAVEAIEAWAKQTTTVAVATETANGSALTFDNLEYGYYVVVSRTSNGGAVSVTSTMPDATIVDKNTTGNTPHFPENGKTVSTPSGTNTVAVGETVTYTVTYKTVNWAGNGEDAKQVISYTVTDTLPEFLSNPKVTSIKVNGKDIALQQFTNKKITIDWATKGDLKCKEEHEHTDACYNWTSIYDNGATLTITYTATVTDKVLESGENNHTNKVSVTYNTTDTKDNNGDDTKKDIYTATIVIDKFAGNPDNATDTSGARLQGAEFKLAKKVVDEEADPKTEKPEKFHYVYAVINADTKVVEWKTEAEGTVATTDSTGAASFAGLASGTYYLFETKAPAGYNKLTDPVEVTVNAATGTTNVSTPAPVANFTGAVLPSTGGIGTTIFYVCGGVLIAAAGILLITKKRMGKAD